MLMLRKFARIANLLNYAGGGNRTHTTLESISLESASRRDRRRAPSSVIFVAGVAVRAAPAKQSKETILERWAETVHLGIELQIQIVSSRQPGAINDRLTHPQTHGLSLLLLVCERASLSRPLPGPASGCCVRLRGSLLVCYPALLMPRSTRLKKPSRATLPSSVQRAKVLRPDADAQIGNQRDEDEPGCPLDQ